MVRGHRRATAVIGAFAVLLVGHSAAMAGNLCHGPCSAVLDFGGGGTIETSQGATITFGGTGSSLQLGTGGSINLGAGGSIADNGVADMSSGGTVTLGPGGAINFGAGGSLSTGGAGQIAFPEDSALNVISAQSVTVDSDNSVYLGVIETSGDVTAEAGGNVHQNNDTPLHLTMRSDDVSTTVTVRAGQDITFQDIDANANSITLQGAGSGSGGSGGERCDSTDGGGVVIVSGESDVGGDSACEPGTVPEPGDLGGEVSLGAVTSAGSSGGALGALSLLILMAFRIPGKPRRR